MLALQAFCSRVKYLWIFHGCVAGVAGVLEIPTILRTLTKNVPVLCPGLGRVQKCVGDLGVAGVQMEDGEGDHDPHLGKFVAAHHDDDLIFKEPEGFLKFRLHGYFRIRCQGFSASISVRMPLSEKMFFTGAVCSL